MKERFQIIYRGTYPATHQRRDNFEPTPNMDHTPSEPAGFQIGQDLGDLKSSMEDCRLYLEALDENHHAPRYFVGHGQYSGGHDEQWDPEKWCDVFEIRRIYHT